MISQLKQLDEISLIELLRVSSEDIVDRFRDLIEDDPNYYNRQLNQWFDDPEEEDDNYN